MNLGEKLKGSGAEEVYVLKLFRWITGRNVLGSYYTQNQTCVMLMLLQKNPDGVSHPKKAIRAPKTFLEWNSILIRYEAIPTPEIGNKV